jgi:pyridoxamine 5'-phosphate oxidase
MADFDLSALRRSYSLKSLSRADVHPDPFEQFGSWFREALDSQVLEPNAMTLATADAQGRPGARIVLLKGFDSQGFVFFTNYESRKGEELEANPQAALLFAWLELERQVRITGTVSRVSEEESRAYFQSRPKPSQIGAWASPQSRVVSGRDVLESRVIDLMEEFKHEEQLPLPPFWGGYRVKPDWFEFWQGRESRLHDRIQYQRVDAGWALDRLAP